MLVVAACGGSSDGNLTQVRSNSGGFLDCSSETVQYSIFEPAVTAGGSSTPSDVLSLLTPDQGLPPGTPTIESETGAEVVFLFTDGDGHRLGRAVVGQLDTGWFILRTERCD
jgi:hypothetical protein